MLWRIIFYFPKAGGQYTYLTEVLASLQVFYTGGDYLRLYKPELLPRFAVAFSKFTAYLIPQLNDAAPLFQQGSFKITWLQILGIGIILLLTYINTRGIKSGKLIQSVFTASKIIALLGLIVLGLLFIKDSHLTENLNIGTKAFQNLKGEGWMPISGKAILGGIAAAMVGSVFSSVAWESVTFVSGR